MIIIVIILLNYANSPFHALILYSKEREREQLREIEQKNREREGGGQREREKGWTNR